MRQPSERPTLLMPLLDSISRRRLLRQASITAAGIVAMFFARLGLPAPLALATDCNSGEGSCSSCISCTPSFTSPGGTCLCQTCCVCESACQGGQQCDPPRFFAVMLCCDHCIGTEGACFTCP